VHVWMAAVEFEGFGDRAVPFVFAGGDHVDGFLTVDRIGIGPSGHVETGYVDGHNVFAVDGSALAIDAGLEGTLMNG
jgi:hypothetical protein